MIEKIEALREEKLKAIKTKRRVEKAIAHTKITFIALATMIFSATLIYLSIFLASMYADYVNYDTYFRSNTIRTDKLELAGTFEEILPYLDNNVTIIVDKAELTIKTKAGYNYITLYKSLSKVDTEQYIALKAEVEQWKNGKRCSLERRRKVVELINDIEAPYLEYIGVKCYKFDSYGSYRKYSKWYEEKREKRKKASRKNEETLACSIKEKREKEKKEFFGEDE